MPKKLISTLCIVILGLFLSCSDYILPKQVKIEGTVNLPVRLGVTDLNAQFMEVLQDAFSIDGYDSGISVINVDYKGQTVQTFCIYIPIELTEDLNPTEFLKTINKQINNSISSEPREINPINMTVPPGGIPVSLIDLPTINPVYLDDIAKYVEGIDFEKCDGTAVDGKVVTGIGLNFFLDKVVDGLEMVIECDELNFSGKPKLLEPGNNIFGNSDDLKLILGGYRNKAKSLNFKIRLQSNNPGNPDYLTGLTPGETVTIMEGKVEFFQNWTEARIDMEEAVITLKQDGEYFIGTFPNVSGGGDDRFDLSELRKFLDGDFIFDGLEANIYTNNPISFNGMHLALEPQYREKASEGQLYDGEFGADELFIMSNHLDEDANYRYEHLPGIDDKNDGINSDVIIDIFNKMPDHLTFNYKIKLTESHLTVYPDMFKDSENSTINIIFLIMLPLRLTVNNDNSIITLPDMFGESEDLFSRNEIAENGGMFESIKFNKIKMTINLLDSIFSGGRLFIDGDNSEDNEPLLFYPNGISMSKKKMIVDFSDSQMEIIRANLIKPNFWMKFKKGDVVTVPKKGGIVNVKIEMNINVGIEDPLE